MLKITPYLGVIVVIVSLLGIFFPYLGYVVALVMITLLIISPFKGRWFCGNLCPRGSFHDFWLKHGSKHKRIPEWLRKNSLRIPVLVLLIGFTFFRIFIVISSQDSIFRKIGMIFVTMCIVTTSISLILGLFISPRTWCSFCPMGTMQKILGKNKMPLKLKKDACVKCGLCVKECPMHLPLKEIINHPDCIKCGRCIQICPKKALYF